VLQGWLVAALGSTENGCLLATPFSRLQKDDVKIFSFAASRAATSEIFTE